MSELVIPVSAELERRLRAAAARRAVPVEEYVTETLEATVPAVTEAEGQEWPSPSRSFRELLGPVQEAAVVRGETEAETEELLRQELLSHRQDRLGPSPDPRRPRTPRVGK